MSDGILFIGGKETMSQAVKDNLSFIGVCLIIIAALIIISALYERFLMKERKKAFDRDK